MQKLLRLIPKFSFPLIPNEPLYKEASNRECQTELGLISVQDTEAKEMATSPDYQKLLDQPKEKVSSNHIKCALVRSGSIECFQALPYTSRQTLLKPESNNRYTLGMFCGTWSFP